MAILVAESVRCCGSVVIYQGEAEEEEDQAEGPVRATESRIICLNLLSTGCDHQQATQSVTRVSKNIVGRLMSRTYLGDQHPAIVDMYFRHEGGG